MLYLLQLSKKKTQRLWPINLGPPVWDLTLQAPASDVTKQDTGLSPAQTSSHPPNPAPPANNGVENGLSSHRSDQIRSVAQLCPTLCDPMNRSMPGLPVHHQHPEFTETHVHRVSDAIQPSHPLSSPSPLAPNPSQQQSLFQ